MLRFRSYLQSIRLHSGLNSGVAVRGRREVSTSPAIKDNNKDEDNEKIVAAVLFERLPVILPKLHPTISTFREFSFQWQHQYRRVYPDEFLEKSVAKDKEDSRIDFVPAPRVTEADKSNDRSFEGRGGWRYHSLQSWEDPLSSSQFKSFHPRFECSEMCLNVCSYTRGLCSCQVATI